MNINVKNKWIITTLNNICYQITDGTHKTPKYQDKGIRFISIKNIRPYKKINWNSYEKYISLEEHRKLIKRAKPEKDDILFPRIGTLGFAKRIDFNEEVSIFVGLGLLKPIKKYINPKYLEYYMNTSMINVLSNKKATGTGRKTLALEETRKIPFPLCSVTEQNRIVEKIEELFSDLDKATEDLKKTQKQLKIYRQAVLKAAFEGNKTSNWKHMKLGGLIKVKSGNGLTRSQRLSSGIFFVYGGNGILGKHNKYMFEETKLIIGRVGVNCGNVHITRPKSWVTDNAFIVSCDNEKACQEYLLYYLEFLNLNKYAGSTAQPVISGHKIYPIDIKLPNKKEQLQIFSKIEKNFSIINKLKETVEQNLSKIEFLRQSILKKAFEGKLVSQDPNDEPAEKLLERIKQEKEKVESNNKKREKR